VLVHRFHRLVLIGTKGNASPIGKHEPLTRANFPDDVLGHCRGSGSELIVFYANSIARSLMGLRSHVHRTEQQTRAGDDAGGAHRPAHHGEQLSRRDFGPPAVFYSGTGSPYSSSLATTTPLPTTSPMKRPRILFWSRQNSKLRFGDFGLLGVNAPCSMPTISRQRPRPCVWPSQRCLASFCQASRIAAGEHLELPMVDLPLRESQSSLDLNKP